MSLNKYLAMVLSLFAVLVVSCGGSLETALENDVFEQTELDVNPNTDEVMKVCMGTVATQSTGLNVRLQPELSDNVCTQLPKGTPVTLVTEEPVNGYYKIQVSDCEDGVKEAYVSANFIALSASCTADESEEEDDRLPAAVPPVDGGVIADVESYIRGNLKRVAQTRPLTRNGASGFVEVFQFPGQGKNVMCGIKHIRDFRSPAFMGADSLCAWASVAQEWRKERCPNNDSHCRIMQGDASFGERLPSPWPHSTHRRGWCVDVWPQRKPGCGEQEITWRSSCYDREDTRALIRLMVKHGGDRGNQLFFNDPQISETRPLANHDDHIHVCFKPSNNTVSRSCDNLTIDKGVCPEF